MKCYCGREMTKKSVSRFLAQSTAFINERIKLLIGEDMRLLPFSTISVATLLQDKGLTGRCNLLERKDVHVEVLQLLVNVLFSATPLTDIVFPKKLHPICAPTNNTCLKNQKEEPGTAAEDKARKIKVKLIVRKSDKKLLYAESGSDFIDLVFSFLTIPTGAIVKLSGGNPPMKSLDSLSSSINDSSIGNLLKPYLSKELLVNPKLAPSFKCENQLLDLIQGNNLESYSSRLNINVKNRNPKSPVRNNDGGNFMKDFEMFVVTDDLMVTSLASTDIVSLLDGFKVPICNVEEILVTVGKCEALNLLKASLGSTTVLTDVFGTSLRAHRK